jgi:hypothetical protein
MEKCFFLTFLELIESSFLTKSSALFSIPAFRFRAGLVSLPKTHLPFLIRSCPEENPEDSSCEFPPPSQAKLMSRSNNQYSRY